ncbi:MAG: MerR family transcriptional regulator [Elusimicrobiota bacterium]|jgi:DNA-binding transcriptional MerR regulator|nr:MerR family transcriptional regulator [Elusimicrobiota bacterium]
MNLDDLQKKDYFTIGDVSKLTGVPGYTIRYWEKSFALIKPIRKESRHRRYSKEDINTLLKIKELIYKHKMTLEGAKKHLSRFMGIGAKPKDNDGIVGGGTARDIKFLKEIKETLSQIIKE